MAVVQLSDQSAVQKVVFDAFRNDTIWDSEFKDLFELDMDVKKETTGGGRYIETALQLAMGGGGRAIGLGSVYLSLSQIPLYANPKIYLRKLHDVMNLSGDTIDRMKTGEEGWLTAMQQALPDLKNRMVHHDDCWMLGIGNGVKARIKASTTGTVGGIAFVASVSAYNTPATGQFAILIDRPFGVAATTEAWRLFCENDSLVFTADATAATPTLRNAGSTQAGTVTTIDEDNGILVITGASALQAAVAASDYMGLGDASGSEFQAASVFTAPQGLYAHVDDGNIVATYFGVSRTNQRLLKARVLNTSTNYNSELSERCLERGDDMLTDRKSQIDTVITSKSGLRQYRQSLRTDRTFIGNATGRGGTESPAPNGKGLIIILGDRQVNVRSSRKIAPEVSFGLANNSGWKLYQTKDLDGAAFDTKTGAEWKQYVDGTGRKDEYFADVFRHAETYCGFPGGNVRFDNLAPSN